MLERTSPVELQDLLDRGLAVPVCPVVFVRLTEALQHIEDRNCRLGRILTADPALTAQVLRIANSAYYGLLRQVRSVDEAILRLGIREVWAVAAALQARELFKNSKQGWSLLNRVLWEHSLKVSTVARCVGQRVRLASPDEVFTAALLHDFGKAMLHRLEPQYELLCQNGALAGKQLTYIECDFFGTDHARLGGEMLRHWDLPQSLARLVGEHHQEPSPDDLAAALHWALALANQVAHGLDEADPEDASFADAHIPSATLASLGLDAAGGAMIAVEAQRQYKTLAGLWHR